MQNYFFKKVIFLFEVNLQVDLFAIVVQQQSFPVISLAFQVEFEYRHYLLICLFNNFSSQLILIQFSGHAALCPWVLSESACQISEYNQICPNGVIENT